MEDVEKTTNQEVKKPFLVKEVQCPVCKETGTHYYLRDHTYNINTRDADYFISDYSWVEPEFEQFNLHGFGLWHCKSCKFTDDRVMFYQKDFIQGRAYFDYLKKVLISRMGNEELFFEKISPYLDYPSHDLQTSLNLTLLAIYIHTLPESIYQNNDKIAKLYLRAAWLFRIMSDKPVTEEIESFLKSYNIKFDRLQANAMNALASVEELNETIVEQNRKKNAMQQWQRQWAKQYGVLADNYKVMCSAIDKVLSAIRIYYEAGNQLQGFLYNADKNLLEMPYHEYPQYSDFISDLQMIHPDLPTSEESAYQKASEYFQLGINSKAYELDSIKKFKIYDLVIVISEKVQDYSTALEYCKVLENLTTSFHQTITERLRKQEIIRDETVDPEHLKALLRRNQELIRGLKIKEKRIKPLKYRRDKMLAQQIVTQAEELDDLDLRSKMEEAQIDNTVIDSYISTTKVEKKKGLFEIFKFSS